MSIEVIHSPLYAVPFRRSETRTAREPRPHSNDYQAGTTRLYQLIAMPTAHDELWFVPEQSSSTTKRPIEKHNCFIHVNVTEHYSLRVYSVF